jgi:hypothetical protein
MIVVYGDESGTHHPEGLKQGSQYPVIAGFAAKKSTWDKFLISWPAVLKKYDDAPYFHGRELEGARLAITENRPMTKQLLKNPYVIRKWDLKRIESFRCALTKIAVADNKIPIMGGITILAFNRIKHLVSDKDPYKYCMSEFFRVYHEETWLQWGNFKSDVQFVFDQNKKEWCDAIHEVFDVYQEKDPRMSGPSFQDKKEYPFWPLQAADLLAYRVRQLIELHYSGKPYELEPNDKVLLKNLLKSAAIINPELKPYLKL